MLWGCDPWRSGWCSTWRRLDGESWHGRRWRRRYLAAGWTLASTTAKMLATSPSIFSLKAKYYQIKKLETFFIHFYVLLMIYSQLPIIQNDTSLTIPENWKSRLNKEYQKTVEHREKKLFMSFIHHHRFFLVILH